MKIVVIPLISANGQTKVRLGSKIKESGNNTPIAGEISNNKALEIMILCS